MKNIMITLLLAVFCSAAFAFQSPQQDTTRRHQDTTGRHPMKSKKKYPGKSPAKRDTMKRKTGDTTRQVPQGM